MRTYSLSFCSDDLERKFSQQNMESNSKAFGRNILFVGILATFISFYSYLHDQQVLIAITTLLFDLQLPFIYLLGRKSPVYFDFCCFAFLSLLNLCAPIVLLLDMNQNPIQDSQTYIIGYAIANMAQSFNLGSRFYLKVIAIFYNLFLLIFIKLFFIKELTLLTLLFFGSNFLMLNYMYCQDRIQRQAFLTKHNEQLWQQKIGTFAKISILTSVSKKGQLLLDLTNCNQISKNEFNISNLSSLREFLNNFKMSQQRFFSTRILNIMRSLQKSSKIQTLHNCINRYSEQTQIDNCEYIGFYNSSLYDVKIFTTWNDDLLNIHTLITKSTIETDREKGILIQNERKLFTNFRQKFAIQIKSIFVKLQSNSYNLNQFIPNEQIISNVYDALRLNYNLQLYLNPQYCLKKSRFLLEPLIKKINSIIHSNLTQPSRIDIQCHIDPYLKVFSCYKTLFQILFNLYSLILRSSQKSGSLLVSVQQRSTQFGSHLNIRIEANFTSLQLIMKGQNLQYKKSIYGKNSQHLVDDEQVNVYQVFQVGIEMIVSEQLLSRIGPIKHIKMVEANQENTLISFTIYQDLSIMNFQSKQMVHQK